MEATKVLIGNSVAVAKPSDLQACLVNIYPVGPAMGSRFRLEGRPALVGRETACDIQLTDDSVSRRHAQIEPAGDGYCVRDLQSTNGTFVNQSRVAERQLEDGDYIHIGNCICRFLAGGNVEAQYHEEIHRLTIIDALTDAYNRRFLLETLAHELAAAARFRSPLALVLFDVDFFKAVNDRLGHLAGDFTLRELAKRVQKVIRKGEVFGRYGGEEFGVVLPGADRDQAMQCAERLRDHVGATPYRYRHESFAVTISLGVAAVAGEDWVTTREVIQLADSNLQRAKDNGRNRVEA